LRRPARPIELIGDDAERAGKIEHGGDAHQRFAASRLRQQHIYAAAPPNHQAGTCQPLERACNQHGSKAVARGADDRRASERQDGGDQIALVTNMTRKPEADRHAPEQRRAVDGGTPARFVARDAEAACDVSQDKVDAVGRIKLHARRKAKAKQQQAKMLRRETQRRPHAG